jgi:DNA repair protein RecO (recombination protein O)
MHSFSVDALVLTRKDFGEADRLLTVFSRTLGKQRLIAKGVRRATSRMAPHVEPGRRSKLFVVERKGLSLVTQAETHELFLSPNNDLETMHDTFRLLEVASNILEEGQRDSRVFDLLMNALRAAATAESSQVGAIRVAFSLQALGLLGYQLELTSCLACSRRLAQESEYYFNVPKGGVIHRSCGHPGIGVYALTYQQLLQLRQLNSVDLVKPLREYQQDLALERAIEAFVEWVTDRQIRSRKLLL